ncbi:GNAT family N-acetyltransferase [Marinomonas sp. A79]|uniref:GNAT family N-acetyltransferase n=1 Tax=Marinomonas vulgaris TaxID=2823372 RepID=A0ABS5H9W7_9GAMM|nr:GNAT family N-acetyltransferase [Marinomonas vulgaris]MBR7888154.1 GNAT family N-acetyltransferase [Marinomonas vulgaris]
MDIIHTKRPSCMIRHASVDDAELVVHFMQELGRFQKMADSIIATPERIARLLEKGIGEAIFISDNGIDVGFAYYYEKSSAFSGRSGLYLDALFIDDAVRGKGIGNLVMQFLSRLAVSRGCEFLEWGCLDWNTPAIEFYQNQGAYCIDNMRIYRLAPDELAKNAALF